MTVPAGSPLRQVHREHFSFVHARKNPYVGKNVLSPLSDSVLRATPRFLDFGPPPAPEEAKAMCAQLGWRSYEFGMDASLEGGAVVITTERPALTFG